LQVVRVAPQQFWPFALAFFKQWQGEFSYIPMSTLTPLEVRRSKLAKLAESVIGSSLANDFKDLLELKGPYGHNAVTDDLTAYPENLVSARYFAGAKNKIKRKGTEYKRL
ncbi:hypothetical protein F5878DRAFT_547098, partial [Lentinula raphanica]